MAKKKTVAQKESPIQSPVDPSLAEKKAMQFGKLLQGILPKGWGYAMLMFRFGPDNGKPPMSDVTYLSNGSRQDMIDTLRAFADQLDKMGKSETVVPSTPEPPAATPPATPPQA